MLSVFPQNFSFPKNEANILSYWQKHDIYKKIVQTHINGEKFRFLDGPPFVSSDTLHYGHIHISMMKSVNNNFRAMCGMHVENIIGYDVHGLPIEMVVSKMLGLNSNDEIRKYGIAKYNAKCAEVINSFSGSWESIFNRIGRFVDFDNEYKTMNVDFMESTWWVFNQLWTKNLIYKGYKIMPYSTECGTALSISEASGPDVYKEVSDPAIYVKLALKDHPHTFLVIWTTTPWTLPSNLAVGANSDILYVVIRDSKSNDLYIVAKNCISNIYGKSAEFEIVDEKINPVGLEYVPLFSYYHYARHTFKVIAADFVNETNGTGLVHLAPAFGQDDFDVCVATQTVTAETVGSYCPVDDNGCFTLPVADYIGQKVLSCNQKIILEIKHRGMLVKKEMYKHSYPHCWRTDTPLIYKAVSSFFVRVTSLCEQMEALNEKITWVPHYIGSARFKNWLHTAKDWGVSRSRFFGTPIPVWISTDNQEMICVGSIEELIKLAGIKTKLQNIHPEFISDITIPSNEGRGQLVWCGEILDCWFESGCVPYGQIHYPFNNNSHIFNTKDFICDFICEGLDQTRGWFYTLTVIAAALFNKPAFKNVICSGMILASTGKKFSKRLGNFTNPTDICDKYGADALRMYLTGSVAAHAEEFKFKESDVEKILLKYVRWLNTHNFLVENILKYHKNAGPLDLTAYKQTANITDLWICSRISEIICGIKSEMNAYTFYKIKPIVLDFMEDLSNWYVKFNRHRLRGKSNLLDQTVSLSTLYHVMITFAKIMAPFSPFFSESIYLNLSTVSGGKESVHLCEYPSSIDWPHSPEIISAMKNLQMIVMCVRNLRDDSLNFKSIKMPVKNITIVNEDPAFIKQIKQLESYIKNETNALNITYNNSGTIDTVKIVCNNKELGTKFKGQASMIKNVLDSVSETDIIAYLQNKDLGLKITVGDIEMFLYEPMFTVSKTRNLILNANESGKIIDQTGIIVDFTQDSHILKLYTIRSFIRFVQQMRKTAKLNPSDPIKIYYQTADVNVDRIIMENIGQISNELGYEVNRTEHLSDEEVIITQQSDTVIVTLTRGD